MALYADIIIDISLEKLDRTFQYLVPAELEQDIGIGMPIEVPFGKGSRRITGYVVNLTTEPSFDPAQKLWRDHEPGTQNRASDQAERE